MIKYLSDNNETVKRKQRHRFYWGVYKVWLLLIMTIWSYSGLTAQDLDAVILDSGVELSTAQSAVNTLFYDLDVEIFPDNKFLSGFLTAKLQIVHPANYIEFDLDTTFTVSSVHIGKLESKFNDINNSHEQYSQADSNNILASTFKSSGSLLLSAAPNTLTLNRDSEAATSGRRVKFRRDDGKIVVTLNRMYQPGEFISVRIAYSGHPRVAPNPPWNGGFTWAETSDGKPWIAVSCQTNGADLWWPVKDHPSDRPDSAAVRITVPEPLFAASNGRLKEIVEHDDRSVTYSWFISTPINTYNITANIAPYDVIQDTYISTAGDTTDVFFWYLPGYRQQATELFPQLFSQLRYFEETLGPYPFRADKFGVVQTPFLGMEHQTLIAYGAGFRNDVLFGLRAGYDDLLHHELAHEWWGNLVTVADWSDFWIHEGFATYMQALYAGYLRGEAYYHRQIAGFRRQVRNTMPLAPRESRSTRQMYGGQDIYYKGAMVLHTLRYLIGDEDFFLLLRRFAYPDPELEQTIDGSAMRFTSTTEFQQITEYVTGQSLSWFFELYVRQPWLPILHTKHEAGDLLIWWEVPDGLEFPMPIEVETSEGVKRILAGNEPVRISDPEGNAVVDPNGWILKTRR